MMRRRELFELLPRLRENVPVVDLADLPTPVSAAPELADRWGLLRLHVKRDDLTSPLYGGSKVRSLEFFFGRALAAKADGVATMGPHGSHQALATAVFARRFGLRSRVVLVPQERVREAVLNETMLPLLGAEVLRCRTYAEVPFQYLRARLTKLGRMRPYWIPPGAADELGVLALVEAVFELVRDIERGALPMPDDIVVPTGTCATAAGLHLGLSMLRLPVRLVAVRVVPKLITGPGRLQRMAESALALLRRYGYAEEVRMGNLLWVDDMAAPGYARPNAWTIPAATDVAEAGGFRTDLTYTAKCLGLLARGTLRRRRVLFWNTYSAVDPTAASSGAISGRPLWTESETA
jgi:D-cysteine desulfhydrase